MASPFVTVDTFATMVHRSVKTVRRWIREGTIVARRPTDGAYLIPRTEITRLERGEPIQSPNAPRAA